MNWNRDPAITREKDDLAKLRDVWQAACQEARKRFLEEVTPPAAAAPRVINVGEAKPGT